MSLAEKITPHIPFLRRYARALTGSQESGDAYVEAAIEALARDPASFPDDVDAKTGLFTVFVKIWNSLDVNVTEPAAAPSASARLLDRRLTTITPQPRQAFLLVYAEGFSREQAAAVMGADVADLDALLQAAREEMADQVSTDVLIIEDEPLIAVDIEDIVTSLGHTSIGTARTKDQALALAKGKTPGLVLADIQLADGSSGIDAVNQMLQSFEAPVIFITAYPERLLTGTRPEPTFLMTKPFEAEALKAVICQALFFEQKAGVKAAN